jgi:hypothetical protein
VSYTELEFETATDAGLPRLVFLLNEDEAVPIPAAKLLDRDAGLMARQWAFRARLLDSEVMAGKFASSEQLEVLLLQALQETRLRETRLRETRLRETRLRETRPSGRIFISYRREDTAYPSGWLFDKLAHHFGQDQIFKDIDSIQLGDDFVDVITAAVEKCDVLLASIGRQWLAVADENGGRRLDNPHDLCGWRLRPL